LTSLSPSHVYSAGLESLAESLVDGYTSPLTWYFLTGVLGAFIQRLVNTLDGALGLLEPAYREQGWFSARLDTVMNFIPARITAYLIIISGSILGYSSLPLSLRIVREYSNRTLSLNAGYPMSAMAGVLGVVLEKPGHYVLGEGRRPNREDLIRGWRVAFVTAILYTVLVASLYILFCFFFKLF